MKQKPNDSWPSASLKSHWNHFSQFVDLLFISPQVAICLWFRNNKHIKTKQIPQTIHLIPFSKMESLNYPFWWYPKNTNMYSSFDPEFPYFPCIVWVANKTRVIPSHHQPSCHGFGYCLHHQAFGALGDLRGEKFAPPCRRFSRSQFGADGLVEMQGGWVMSEDMADMLKLFGVWKSQIRKTGLGDCPYTIHGSGIFTYT